MVLLTNNATGETKEYNPEDASRLIASRAYSAADGSTINVKSAAGPTYGVSTEQYAQGSYDHLTPETSMDRGQIAYDSLMESRYGSGLGNRALAFLEGAASMGTLGFADSLMDDEATRARAKYMPGTRLAGGVVPLLLSAIPTGGGSLAARGALSLGEVAAEGAGAARILGGAAEVANAGRLTRAAQATKGVLQGPASFVQNFTPLGWATKAGRAVEGAVGARMGVGAVEGASMLGRAARAVAPSAAGMATEFGLMDAAFNVSDLMMSDDPITPEALVGAAGSGLFHGVLFGGALGIGGGALIHGGAKIVEKAGEKFGKIATKVGAKADDFDNISKAIHSEEPAAKQFREGIAKEYGSALENNALDIDAIRTTLEADSRVPAAQRAFSPEQTKTINSAIDRLEKAQKAFPFKAKSVFEQGTNSTKWVIDEKNITKFFGKDFDKNWTNLAEWENATKHLGDSAQGLMGEAFIPAHEKLLKAMNDANEANKLINMRKLSKLDYVALAAQVPGASDIVQKVPVIGPLAGDMLRFYLIYRAARVALGGSKEGAEKALGVIGQKLGGKASILGGPISVAAKVSKLAGGKVQQITEGTTRFIRGSGKVGRKAAPLTAGAILSNKEYFFGDDETEGKTVKGTSLGQLYQKRAKQLAQTVASPQALEARALASVSRIAEINPQLAQAIAATAQRGMEYMFKTMPKNPGLGSLFDPHGSRYTPSDAEISKWARIVAAVNDPSYIIDAMQEGTLTKDQVEAVKTVYPVYFSRVQQMLVEKAGEMGSDLGYEQRLQLSQLYDVEIDSVMRPSFILSMQSNFDAAEEESQEESTPGVKPNMTGMGRISKSERLDTPSNRLLDR